MEFPVFPQVESQILQDLDSRVLVSIKNMYYKFWKVVLADKA